MLRCLLPSSRVRALLAAASALPMAALSTIPADAQVASTTLPAKDDASVDDQVDASPSPQNRGIQDIVVTARKRSENLRDVPIAVTAITGDQLQQKNITQLIDLAAATPNFQFSNGAVQAFTFIRGFGSGANAAFEQSVGKFVDNVSFGRDQDGRVPIFDVERLEVLKGPQVLAFGNSATVGALNFTTRKPGKRFEANGTVAYEFVDDELQFQGGVTAPLSDWASLRVAGLYQRLDRGRVFNPSAGRHEPTNRNWAVRPTLRLTPAAGLEVLLHGEYDRVRDFGSAVQNIAQPLNPAARRYDEVGNRNLRNVDYDRAPYFSRELIGLNAQLYQGDIHYDVLSGQLTSTTAFRRTRADTQFGVDGPDHSTPYFNALFQRYRQFSQEIRFNGRYGFLDVAGGGYYQNDTLRIDVLQEFALGGYGLTGGAATPFGRLGEYDQRARTYSGFIDLTAHVDDRLSLSGGLRYARNEKQAGQLIDAVSIIPNVGFDSSREYLDGYRSPALRGLLTAVLGSPAHTFPFGTLKLAEDHWQPQAIIQYRITPRDNAYAKYVRGDKVGGFDYFFAGSNPSLARFRPERAESFELGFKGLTLANRLDYSVSIYRTTFTSLQQSVFSNLVFLVSNVGRARSQGIDAELTFAPTDGLRLGLAGSYLDAKFVDFPGAACGTAQNLAVPRGCSQDLSGTRTPYSSRWTGTASFDYQMDVADGGYRLGAGVSMLARTSYNAGAYNDPRMVQGGFAQVDAHLELRPTGGPWTLAFFGRNLTDRQVLEYATLQPAQSTAIAGSYARGRQLGLRLGVEFR